MTREEFYKLDCKKQEELILDAVCHLIFVKDFQIKMGFMRMEEIEIMEIVMMEAMEQIKKKSARTLADKHKQVAEKGFEPPTPRV